MALASPVSPLGSSLRTVRAVTMTAMALASSVLTAEARADEAEATPPATTPATPAEAAPSAPLATSGDATRSCTECCDKPDCSCPSTKDGTCAPSRLPWDSGGVVGLRGSITHTGGAESDGTFGAATLAIAAETYATHGYTTWHGTSLAMIGGGSAGFEGALDGSLTGGLRIPVGEHHGPLVRLGVGGALQGNKRFYFSRLSLPVGELAYQYLRGRTVLELGARGAVNLVGRYNTGHVTRREIDGLEWGGYLAAHASFGRLDVSYARMETKSFPGGAVDLVRGWACGYLGHHFALCGDATFLHGPASWGPADTRTTVDALYAGVTVGLSE